MGQDFNPLHHEGGDPDNLVVLPSPGISIHSTTRVETRYGVTVAAVLDYFNPLHHEGGDKLRLPR